jgi:hypothetical protein
VPSGITLLEKRHFWNAAIQLISHIWAASRDNRSDFAAIERKMISLP